MAVILVLLFVFQILLLKPFYEEIKKNDVVSTANSIEKYIGSDNLDDILVQNSQSNEMCIMVVSSEDSLSLNSNIGCPMNRLTQSEIYYYTQEAIKNGGTLLVKDKVPSFNIRQKDNSKLVVETRGFDSLIYFKGVNIGNINHFIIVSTNITPINATTRTLSYQLMFISIVVIISTILLTYIITKRFVKPLEHVNEAAKELADGKYGLRSDKSFSKELFELNETLINAAKDINKADNAKRDLIANVSHDLRTPLTMISGYGEMMLDLPNEMNKENIKVIVDESKRLSNLVNDLLDLSKLQEHKIKISKDDFSINELIKEIIGKYKLYEFEIIFNYNDNININGDRLRISQVIHNFIDNAINYSNGIKKIIINQVVEDSVVRIEVIDFGKGIEKDKLNLVWDRYYKADKHIRYSTGSGIGLAIAKEILELHGYKYGVDSKINEGSVFYFEANITNK